ncbi:Yip1 family protein [Verrucomicrobiota bacterium]
MKATDQTPDCPPPLPYDKKVSPEERRMSESFTHDFGPMKKRATLFAVIETLLKCPASVIHEIAHGKLWRMVFILLTIIIVSMSGYGFIMGTFSGGHQLWAVPLKLVIGIFLSALICLPSLYIFMCLSGGDQSLQEVWAFFLSSLALSGILLVGFAPVAWIFSQSTNAVGFMAFLHMAFWIVGIYFGLHLLKTALDFLNKRNTSILRIWSVIFTLVVLQMCTTLRPLVGEFQGRGLQDKKFFLTHWKDCGR